MTDKEQAYYEFLNGKVKLAEQTGFEFDEKLIPDIMKPHQKDITRWAVNGGRRAIFGSFGTGKTFIQETVGDIVVKHTNKPFLIGMPLGVRGEFRRARKSETPGNRHTVGVRGTNGTEPGSHGTLKVEG